MITLLIATRNSHKVAEIRSILGADFHYRSLTDFPACPNVREDAATFVGNATKKAVEIAQWIAASGADEARPPITTRFVLADDSGLEVDFLQGQPGVHSARFAALDSGQNENSSSEANNEKLLRALRGVPRGARTARFRCVVALVPLPAALPWPVSPGYRRPDGAFVAELFEGACEGRIGFAASGQGGFGYDPLFVPEGYEKTFAELSEEEKNRLSHRGKALAKLRVRLEAMISPKTLIQPVP